MAAYVILEGILNSQQEADFSIQFYWLKYDIESAIELANESKYQIKKLIFMNLKPVYMDDKSRVILLFFVVCFLISKYYLIKKKLAHNNRQKMLKLILSVV